MFHKEYTESEDIELGSKYLLRDNKTSEEDEVNCTFRRICCECIGGIFWILAHLIFIFGYNYLADFYWGFMSKYLPPPFSYILVGFILILFYYITLVYFVVYWNCLGCITISLMPS